MRLDINYKEKTVKNTNTWRLNNAFLNNEQATEEIKKEIQTFLETNDNEIMMSQNLWNAAKAVLRGKFIYSNRILPQETRKILNRQPNFTPKTTGKKNRKTPNLVKGKKS